MEKDNQNKNKSNSEMIPFNISKLSTLQYVKVIFIDKNKELQELRADSNSINSDIIQLYFSSKENINVNCPIGVVLKFITLDAIYFAKVILKENKKAGDKFIFILSAPQKTIRQQNRKFYRINIERPCVLLVNNEKNNPRTYIAQSVNISKGGILINGVESILNDEQINLKHSKGDSFYIAMFLEQGIKVKSSAQFVRSECIDGSYRYAFQFLEMSQKNIVPFDKYLTNEEFKILKSMKSR